MSDQPPAPPEGTHPLLWPRMIAEHQAPPAPRSPTEALAMMERSHAATMALLPETEGEAAAEPLPLTRAWFDSVREACARTGRVPGVDRMLFEWWVNDPPAKELNQLPWLFGVWQGHWICWAGTTPWAGADLSAKTLYDADQIASAVQFGADPGKPPAQPWPPFGTSALAVPTVILLALSGKPAPKDRLIPATPLPVAPPPPPEPAPVAEVAPSDTPPAPPPPQNLPPAGWHADPSGRHALRYWDGTAWTDHAADPGTDTIEDPL